MIKILCYVFVVCLAGGGSYAFAVTFTGNKQETHAEPDKSEAPFFNSADEDFDLPLQKTDTAISIDGNIANIRVTQTYINEGQSPIEAVYTFPGSTRAAVYGLTIKIGDRITKAVIKEKQVARAEYEQAKSEGKSASLLEQQKPNVFTMSVANILPGDVVDVELQYTELMQISNNIYELSYPMTIGERYTSASAEEKIDRLSSDSILEPNSGSKVNFSSSIKVQVNSAIPISEINSPSHEIDVTRLSQNSSQVSLSDPDEPANRDFVLRYQLAANQIQTGILLHEGENENYFVIQMEPPKRVKESLIVNREYIFVIDISGSMAGEPLDISKQLIMELLESLNPWEKFNVIFFAGGSKILSPHSLDVNKDSIQKMKEMLGELQGGGGTELLNALESVNKIPKPEGYSRNVITITDGYVTVEPEVFRLINKNTNEANYFSFGIGNSVNRHLVEVIARAGFGESFIALNKNEAKTQGRKLLDFIRYPLLSNITIDFDGFNAYDIQPFYTPDLFANKPLVISGKWQGPAEGKVIIEGKSGNENWRKTLDVSSSTHLKSRALEYIWARREIRQLSDLYSLESSEVLERQITELSLKHNILSKFTSFLAVDNVVRTTAESKTKLQGRYRSSNGFVIPLLNFGAQLTSAVPPIRAHKNISKNIQGYEFTQVGDEWVDIRHHILTPIVEISRTAKLFELLSVHLNILNHLNNDEIYYIYLGDFTIKVVNKSFNMNEKDSSMIEEYINALN